MKYYLLLSFFILSYLSFGQKDNMSFYPFKDANGWGVKRANGVDLFSARYDSVLISNYSPYNNRIRVQKNDLWGIVDSFGLTVIPPKYVFIENDRFGYSVYNEYSWAKATVGFLNLKGDEIVPIEHRLVSSESIGKDGNFLILAMKSYEKENFAIFSSDGIRRTEYEFDELIAIDSARFFSSNPNPSNYYFGFHSIETDKYGVYDGVNNRIVAPPKYNGVCTSWCELSENPHFQEGPIVYIGSTPIFHLPIGDDFEILNIHGELVHKVKNLSEWNNGKRYYLNELGETKEVIGTCVNGTDNLQPPFVMRDDAGYFIVDFYGEPLLENKRFLHIERFNLSEVKDPKYNVYELEDEFGLKSMLDYKLQERIPSDYVSIAFHQNYLNCKRKDGSYDFFDSTFVKLENDPGVYHPVHRFFFTRRGADGYNRYGVKSKDSVVLIPTKYVSLQNISKHRTQSDTMFYILFDGENTVDLFNEKVEKVMSFNAQEVGFYDRFQTNGQPLLLLSNDKSLSMYNLESKEWSLKGLPCVPIDSLKIFRARNWNLKKKSYSFIKLEHYKGNEYFWIYNLETGWNLFNYRGDVLMQWNRRTNGTPMIVYMDSSTVFAIQRTQEEDGYEAFIANNFGDELHLDGELLDYRFVPELNRVFIKSRPNRHLNEVYDNHFNFIENLEGRIYTEENEPFYVHFDKNKKHCDVVSAEGKQRFTNVINFSRYGGGILCITDSFIKHHAFSKHSVNSIKEYARTPHDLSDEIIICNLDHFGISMRSDFYSSSGVLLFENFQYITTGKRGSKDEYFILRNDHSELWVTKYGKIFHRNAL